MPGDCESVSLSYRYPRHGRQSALAPQQSPPFIATPEINIIDLGLISPAGVQVGASGSDKQTITVSPTGATPGYQPVELDPGEWRILLGAYKVAAEGVSVEYDITFVPKRMRLFKGDLHTHTLASDGVLSTAELAQHALRNGLNFLAITDHNQMVSLGSLPRIPGMTLIPGIEWTHYRGHANFLGVDHPYHEPFFANHPDEMAARFHSAHANGALIVINHPFDEGCPFEVDLNQIPFDCLEVWNGPMRLSNLKAMGLWQQMLVAGKKIPACGGSDYHRDQLFNSLAGPTTCIYAPSASVTDLLDGLRRGHAYITFSPNGPALELKAGEAIMGDSLPFSQTHTIEFHAFGLLSGDVLQVQTAQGATPLLQAQGRGEAIGSYTVAAPGFARIEILRPFLPGLPPLPALVANPIYFDAA